jgi:hypothetical protein
MATIIEETAAPLTLRKVLRTIHSWESGLPLQAQVDPLALGLFFRRA